MNGSFFDDEEEIEMRPRRKVRRQVKDDTVNMVENSPKRREPMVREENVSPGPVRRKVGKEVREMRDPEGFSPDLDVIKYIALALLVIGDAVFTAKCLEITGAAILVIVMIQVILLLMGFLLRRTPVFIPLFLAVLILLVGIITGNTEIVLCGNATFLAAVLTLRS